MMEKMNNIYIKKGNLKKTL